MVRMDGALPNMRRGLSLHLQIQNGPGERPASYPMGTDDSLFEYKVSIDFKSTIHLQYVEQCLHFHGVVFKHILSTE
jgi:hypothetical protein